MTSSPNPDPLSLFHPAVVRWFRSCFAEPTPAQARGWPAIRSARHTLIAAPTGSGKTLAAFLASLDELLRDGLEGRLNDETRIVYVSPLKALSNDIHKNLAEPRRGIRKTLEEMGLPAVQIRAAVRTGDTPSAERQAMIRTPPHILVTTPESLYLLLTAERSRNMLRSARTVIVDEIHAVLDDRRGAHLAISLERLEHVTGGRLTRIGLSATQKPIEEVARFLVGTQNLDANGNPDCVIIDEGHRRELDLAIEIPESPLEAVMSAEVWQEVYNRIAQLISEHRTTLVFVNTRRLAERVTRQLSDRLGEDAVTSHHGSLSREMRLDAEARLKEGKLKALVATASLELGIDIGYVDLVCQIGSTRWISTLLQRVGRSGHTVHGTPKGRIFPLTRDELVECAALVRTVRHGELDRVAIPEKPLDVLAQQIVAEAACEDWSEDALYELVRRAYPYRNLARDEFAEVVRMLAQGFSTRRGRRGSLIHYDGVHRRLRGRKGARLTAITCGGAIPDTADYAVVVEPTGTFIGTLNEDFAIESLPGDIFQLGNASWLILRIESGRVRVEDAHGQPPSIPFWLGEAPARSDELSAAVSRLREEIAKRLDDPEAAIAWLVAECGLSRPAAFQIVEYLGETRRMLGVIPTQRALVLERFFDESGGMQIVLHAPFGSRINRAWGLALRKRFCRTFNFELQAAATEDGLVLSLGPQHSFPLDDVFHYLKPPTVRDILVQALLDAPMFQTRWRWNATRALAVRRQRGGQKTPTPLQRMESEDLLAAVFPDAMACLENIAGDREIPDHPLVHQTIQDCLTEAMDLPGLVCVLEAIEAGAITCLARDTVEPSPLCHEILNAKPYAFLDDAPLEERRTQAVYMRRALEPWSAADLGALDPAAIARVRDEAWPRAESADELHDALLITGFLTEAEGLAGHGGESWRPYFEELAAARRATRIVRDGANPNRNLWIAAERLPQILATFPAAGIEPPIEAPEPERSARWERHDAIRELLRGRLEAIGPTTARELTASLGVHESETEAALAALEAQGAVLRGRFTPDAEEREWCERRLLARIHRYTLNRLRAEIEPVSAADFMRFLFAWQRLDPEHHVAEPDGLLALVQLLDGYELPAAGWEADVLTPRMVEYDPLWLDGLCLAGQVGWGRLSPPSISPSTGSPISPCSPDGQLGLGLPTGIAAPRNSKAALSGPIRSTPIAVFLRQHAAEWLRASPQPNGFDFTPEARDVLSVLERRGASFFEELVSESRLLRTQVEDALGELVALGCVTSDSFAGLRALLIPSSRRRPLAGGIRKRRTAPFGVERAGRWSILRRPREGGRADGLREELDPGLIELQARVLLRRYGVVFRRLLQRETNMAPWRDLVRTYRRLEARGEIRGGLFVSGFSGEQYALPEAVGQLRSIRKTEPRGQLIAVSGVDPLSLTGIITPGERIPALPTNRVLYRDGVPIAAIESGVFRALAELDPASMREAQGAIVRRRVSPALRVYLGKTI